MPKTRNLRLTAIRSLFTFASLRHPEHAHTIARVLAIDDVVRDAVSRRHLALQRTVAQLTGADALQVRTFFATGLVITLSTALALPGRRTDATWGAWLLELVDPATPPTAT